MRKNRGVLPLAMLVLSGSFLLSGCGEEQKQGGEMPPPDVKVVTLKAAPLTVSTELPGTNFCLPHRGSAPSGRRHYFKTQLQRRK